MFEDRDAVISVNDNSIAVYGIKSGTSINIYTVDGCLLQSTVANGEETTIVFDSTIKGIVVVQIGAKAYKVKL